jgi:4'-phosphopantetheinyl transferase
MQSIGSVSQRDAALPRVTVRLLCTDAVADGDADLLARLDAREAAQAARFVHAADRQAYLGAHALLRTLLSRAIANARAPAAWRFVEGDRGKPRLAPGQSSRDLRFNLSHCRGMVAVAMAPGAEVGIDVEALERHDFDELDIAASHFCPAEREPLARIADRSHRKRAFLAVWTAKEALVKALGDGLSMPLESFCADLDRGAYVRYDEPARSAEWTLARWERPTHAVALAAPEGMAVECREVRWDASCGDFVEGARLDPLGNGARP